MASVHCAKCLTSRSGDQLGQPCRTDGCDGIIEREPEFRELVDELPEPQTCGRRFDGKENQDRWLKFKTNGDRVCSYCGSFHPDDFFSLLKLAAEAPADVNYSSVPELELTDKSYKFYIKRPGVRNAHQGGIKFYTHHLPEVVTAEQAEVFKAAAKKSQDRYAQLLRR